MRHLIDILDLSTQEIKEILDQADEIIAHPEEYRERCKYKKLATLFFEPSTRTRLSFEAAMLELGGSVLGFSEASSSSAAKGESVADTIRVVGCYADIIAMRHPKEGAPMVAAMHSAVPIINAGDGGHNHPTQTLTDLLTIRRERGSLDNFTIGLCGDLKFGRTVHSLIEALSRSSGIKFVLISPEELKLPSYIKKDVLQKKGLEYSQETDLAAVMPELDILYMTRVQRGGLHPPEGQLHPYPGEAGRGEKGTAHPAPPAPRERNFHRHRRRPPRLLFPPGPLRKVRPHGPYTEAAGGVT